MELLTRLGPSPFSSLAVENKCRSDQESSQENVEENVATLLAAPLPGLGELVIVGRKLSVPEPVAS